jgi:hypothetical protein
MMEQFANVETLHVQPAVVRKGYLPERVVLTAADPIPVKLSKVREVQFDDCVAMCEGVAPCKRGAAVAVSKGHLDRRHGRSVEHAARRGRQVLIGRRREPDDGAMGRRTCGVGPALHVGVALVYWCFDGHPYGLRSENSDDHVYCRSAV